MVVDGVMWLRYGSGEGGRMVVKVECGCCGIGSKGWWCGGMVVDGRWNGGGGKG